MVFIKWLLCGCLSIPMTILGKALCWVLPFFVDEETKRLPKWLDWFMTDDNDADGDAGHWERNPGTGKWATTYVVQSGSGAILATASIAKLLASSAGRQTSSNSLVTSMSVASLFVRGQTGITCIATAS